MEFDQMGPEIVVAVILGGLLGLALAWLLWKRGRDQGSGRTYIGPTPPSLERRSFMPFEFVLQLSHQEGALTPDEVASRLATLRKQLGIEREWGIAEPITTIQKPNQDGYWSFPLVQTDESDADLTDLVRRINALGDEDKDGDKDGIGIAGAMLNRLISCANLGGSPTGGPGGPPVRASNVSAGASRVKSKVECSEKQKVQVAILDTLPCWHAMAAQYVREEIRERHSPGSGHPLILSLLRPNLPNRGARPIQFHPATYDDLIGMGYYPIKCQEYKMADHGLFIAGLIHEMIPTARLHLIEVMGEYGVGSVVSLARGIGKIQQLAAASPDDAWVVNCSFTFVEGHDERTRRDFQAQQQYINSLLGSSPKICVVAAAGNDYQLDCDDPSAKLPPQRPAARYPAAMWDVLGVAALDRSGNPASYSNLPDLQPDEGFWTLGGEKGHGHGLLGVYIGDLPVARTSSAAWMYDPNTTGWAWWSGSSFAAAVLSGMAAAALSQGFSGRAVDHVKATLALQAITPPPDPTGHRIIVSQP